MALTLFFRTVAPSQYQRALSDRVKWLLGKTTLFCSLEKKLLVGTLSKSQVILSKLPACDACFDLGKGRAKRECLQSAVVAPSFMSRAIKTALCLAQSPVDVTAICLTLPMLGDIPGRIHLLSSWLSTALLFSSVDK